MVLGVQWLKNFSNLTMEFDYEGKHHILKRILLKKVSIMKEGGTGRLDKTS